MWKILIGIIFICIQSHAQVNHQVKLMTWNVLNWPSSSNLVGDTTTRCPAYRAIVEYARPDILITSENTSYSGTVYFLNQVMNTGGYQYAAGTFINGYDTDNAIYYRDSLFDFVSNVPIQTSLRDINHYTLVFKLTGDTLHIFSCHLKAGQGYEPERAAEVSKLRQVTDAFPSGTNFLIGGDFNIYNASEPAYLALLRDNVGDDGNFKDPLYMPGVWNSYNYREYHTQSTHYNSSGSFPGGGMDDRFDMILYSNAVEQPTGIYFLPGTYINIGNDGNHYNKDINWGLNTAVPANIADALYDASDHLPVMLTLSIGPTSDIGNEYADFKNLSIYPNPVPLNEMLSLNFTLIKGSDFSYIIYDLEGRILYKSPTEELSNGPYNIPIHQSVLQKPGMYFIASKFDNILKYSRLFVVN